MNYQDAVKKINKLLGLHKFNSYKIAGKDTELVVDGNIAVDEPIYTITNNGQLPAPDGEYELEDTTKIKIKDGKVQEIKYDMEKKTENFVEAMLKDGTVVKSPTFDVGEDIFVVSPDGKEAPAPDGEHELSLKDSEGKDVLIKVITKDGKIVERENVELPSGEEDAIEEEMGMTPDLSIGNDVIDGDFKKAIMSALGEIKDAIGGIIKDQEEMKAKMSKFSKEPAGEPVKQPKNVGADLNASKNELFNKLREVRLNSYKK